MARKYFDGEISHGFVSLYTGKTIIMVATGLLGLFLPIFLYNLFGQNFQFTLLYYALGYFFYALLVAFGARFLNKFGFRRALRFSVFLGALFYTIFYFMDKGSIAYLIPLSILVVVLYRLLYWLPFHVDFAKFTDKKNRGRQLSAIMATRMAIGIIIPLVAGFIISRFGFNVLFLMAIIIYLISGIPYLTIPRTEEKFSWGYFETWKRLFSKERRSSVYAFMADGAEGTVGFLVWPIFIFQLLDGNYFQVGAVSTLIIAITVAFQLITGKYIDKKAQKEKVMHLGSVLYALGWIVKIFIATTFQIFIAGTYHNLMKIFIRTPFDTITYEMAADNGHYVDEFTVLHEMAINFGRVLMIILMVVISMFLAVQWTFALAAGAALLLNFLKTKDGIILPRAGI